MRPWGLLLALCWYVHMNDYFGWNRLPQSPEECLCDGVLFLILALALR